MFVEQYIITEDSSEANSPLEAGMRDRKDLGRSDTFILPQGSYFTSRALILSPCLVPLVPMGLQPPNN